MQADPSYRPSKQPLDGRAGSVVPPFAGSDLILSPSQWSSHVVGEIILVGPVHKP